MEYLHDHCNMMHRDMKSPNLLIDEHGRVRGVTGYVTVTPGRPGNGPRPPPIGSNMS